MNQKWISTASLFALVGLSGCVRETYVDRPAVTGQVLWPDGTPAPQATVFMVQGRKSPEAECIADQDGRFHFPEVSHIYYRPIVGDVAYFSHAVYGFKDSMYTPITQIGVFTESASDETPPLILKLSRSDHPETDVPPTAVLR